MTARHIDLMLAALFGVSVLLGLYAYSGYAMLASAATHPDYPQEVAKTVTWRWLAGVALGAAGATASSIALWNRHRSKKTT